MTPKVNELVEDLFEFVKLESLNYTLNIDIDGFPRRRKDGFCHKDTFK